MINREGAPGICISLGIEIGREYIWGGLGCVSMEFAHRAQEYSKRSVCE